MQYFDELITQEIERVYILKDIDDVTTKDFAEIIYKINREDEINARKYKDFVAEPIKLIVSSFGGSVYDGLALIAAMKESNAEIHTYAHGMVMSMGVPIFLYGDKRFADEFATFMIHDVSSGSFGTIEQIEEDVAEGKRLRNVINEIIVKRTKIKKTELNAIIKTKSDWYIPASNAIQFGLCSAIT